MFNRQKSQPITILTATLLCACSGDPPTSGATGGITSAGGQSDNTAGQGGMSGSGGAPNVGGSGASDFDCDVSKSDCPDLIALRVGDSYTIYLPAVAEGKDASEFSASGTAPQLAVGAVTIGLDDPPDTAHITVTGNAAGNASLTVTLWYGDNKEVERVYAFALEVIAR